MKMKLTKSGLLAGVLCLAAAGLAGRVTRADDSAKQTTISIQAPTQVPGSVLPAGRYTFKNSSSQSGWSIVQIYNNDGSALVTTILAYPNPKVASNGQNVVIYPANGAGSIPAMEGVIFAGDSTVEQFAYPKSTADQIGAANQLRIPTTGTDDAYPSALPDAASSWSAPVMSNSASDPNADATMTAQNGAEATAHDLPQTASPLPLILLVGLVALAGIAILRRMTSRKA